MSQTASAATGKPYGVERVCRVWEQARSTHYDRQERAHKAAQGIQPGRRGPRPAVPDDVLLDLIRRDLAASPFRGEGRCASTGCSARTGVDRGSRGRTRAPITTAAPNQMWGTDATKVFTVDEGWVWVFVAVEHWNAECVGWHVTKEGTRFAALEPLIQGLTNLYGSVAADVARGLLLRMDHGSQYLSDHFVNQVRFWGIKPSFAFVEEPQTNAVAERCNRTLKEQVIYGTIFRNAEEVRTAVGRFVEIYNNEWRVEKNGGISPREARKTWIAALDQAAA